ncbi:MAG TPA: ParA family protein [Candidatus Saccharimonadia bacterium]|nr:ParA family protein [Candidatus Saccharimonadia bacterium]
MQILTIASQKGGTGKTTLSAHLAVEAELAGAGPVAVVDTDPQGSLAAWWNTRVAATPLFAAVNIAQIEAHLARLRAQGINLVIIDTPPQRIETIEAANIAADLVLIPARPSPHDLRAVATLVDIVEQSAKPFCFVVNGATPRSTIATDAVRALAEHGKVAPVTIHHRVDFAVSMIDGRTVGELAPQSRSAEEITSLWKYVCTQLQKSVRRRRHA